MMFLDSGANYKKKLDICKSCESYNNVTTACKECGCLMLFNARLSGNNCPLNKHSVD